MNKPLLFIAILLLVCVGSSVNVTTTDVNSDTEELFEHLSLEIIRPPSSSSLRKIIAPIETTVSSSSSTVQHSGETPTTATKGNDVFQNALKKAIGGGVPGAGEIQTFVLAFFFVLIFLLHHLKYKRNLVAGVIQVLSLMWLRTIVNYQYRYGSNFIQSLSHLYSNGGISRLYSGLGFALVQAPISRFVSTAANDGVHNLIKNLEWTKHWGPGREVVVAAFVVGFFRMVRVIFLHI
jgi:predicted PurR-regulated permease PerM